MKEEYKTIPLINNEAKSRFEIAIESNIAFIEYKKNGTQIALMHTKVPKALGGRGVAAALVEKTFNHIEAHNQSLLPFCTYVFAYIQKHPQWKRIVDKQFKGYSAL